MDQLDHNLLAAWHRVFERCKADPTEARRRYERTLPGTTLDRPVRAWCVAVRASDTRLMAEGVRGEGIGGSGDPICAQTTHKIVLDGWALRRLGGAVQIPYPGVPIDVAADLLGKHKEALRNWMSARPGRTRAARAEAGRGGGLDDRLVWQEHPPREGFPLGVRYEPQRTHGRNSGMETPVVWSDGPLDPGASKGRPPAVWWGSMWMSLAERIPEGFEQVVERVPRFVPYPEVDGRKRPRFRGWRWVCPGLAEARGVRREARSEAAPSIQERTFEETTQASGLKPQDLRGCGRHVAVLYAPLPAWTVGRALGIDEGLEVEGLSGQWLPGVMDRWAGRRRLACERCWRVRRTSFTDHRGWNEMVSQLSGGLLFGREVARPSDFEYERKRAYRARRQRKTGSCKPIDSPILADSVGAV